MRDETKYEAAVAALRDRCPRPGSFWRHRNGTVYAVSHGAIIEATLTPSVVYYLAETWPPGSRLCWVRPLEEFLDGRFTPAE